MSISTVHPRPDQILELSKGLELPLPEVHATHLEVIAEAFACAYQKVLTQHPVTAKTGSEAEVTALLETSLNNMIEDDPLWRQLVLCVARGKESLSVDGSHLEKRPDLSIYLTDRNRNFPLVTEAKILDTPTGKTEKLYCEKGVRRFIDGEYAWATREAFMLAYIRDGSTISTKLTPLLSSASAHDSTGYSVDELPTPIGAPSIDLSRSKHGRSFAYKHQTPPDNVPGSIDLWHLWVA